MRKIRVLYRGGEHLVAPDLARHLAGRGATILGEVFETPEGEPMAPPAEGEQGPDPEGGSRAGRKRRDADANPPRA